MQTADQWVSLPWQYKNNTEPREMFASHPNLTFIARYQTQFLLCLPGVIWSETCFPFSPSTHLHVSYTSPTSKMNLMQCTSVWFQDKPGTCGSKPAGAHIFNVIIRNDQLAFVKIFGALSQYYWCTFMWRTAVLNGGKFASQGPFVNVWRHFGLLQLRD